MKQLAQFIQEKLQIKKDSKIKYPEEIQEVINSIYKCIEEDSDDHKYSYNKVILYVENDRNIISFRGEYCWTYDKEDDEFNDLFKTLKEKYYESFKKDLKEFCEERETSLYVKDNHFEVKYGNKIKSLDEKYKYVFIFGDDYCGHMKDFGIYDDQEEVRLHWNRDWDLPELVFGEKKENLHKLIDDVENDGYFCDYGGSLRGTIIHIDEIKSKINIFDNMFI